jgi:dihydroorotate dehydrogenase
MSNSLQEIERAIAALTPDELEQLYSWLEEHQPHPLDVRIKSDLDAGHLDAAIQRAIEDEKDGRTKPL